MGLPPFRGMIIPGGGAKVSCSLEFTTLVPTHYCGRTTRGPFILMAPMRQSIEPIKPDQVRWAGGSGRWMREQPVGNQSRSRLRGEFARLVLDRRSPENRALPVDPAAGQRQVWTRVSGA